ncbi:hypothetical protein DSL72_001052 [Monilinia vaccinii-corymbosi]|uniref:Uncharacterized protein n=1 Tax=Monilinia vaccinii-corymbosi TaxID=61207 RepID=A0A8A3PAH7_9HELO|nr:hypothetical protein DSL72_001052 [Monilinia vaccinii-corymbosi]
MWLRNSALYESGPHALKDTGPGIHEAGSGNKPGASCCSTTSPVPRREAIHLTLYTGLNHIWAFPFLVTPWSTITLSNQPIVSGKPNLHQVILATPEAVV